MNNKPVYWTNTAREDLNSIITHIAADSIKNALVILDKLETKAESLSEQSERGRIVPELQIVGVNHYLEIIIKPWRIIYRVETDKVMIMTVLDSRRDLEDLLLERLIQS